MAALKVKKEILNANFKYLIEKNISTFTHYLKYKNHTKMQVLYIFMTLVFQIINLFVFVKDLFIKIFPNIFFTFTFDLLNVLYIYENALLRNYQKK